MAPLSNPKRLSKSSSNKLGRQADPVRTAIGTTSPQSALAEYFRSSTPELDKHIETAQNQRAIFEEFARKLSLGAKENMEKPAQHGLQRLAPTHGSGYRPWDISSGLGCELNPGLPGEEIPAEQRIAELLEILWADTQHWRNVQSDLSRVEISRYIQRRYGLRIPPVPASAWRQMVTQPAKRRTLFELWGIGFTDEVDWHLFGELMQKLSRELAGELLWEYLSSPKLPHTHLLASQKLSPEALASLSKALKKMVKDVEWCRNNPGVIPPQLAPWPKHRSLDVTRARRIEALVKLLEADPESTDYELGRTEDGRPSEAIRKLAGEARLLLELREGVQVMHHSENRDGRIIGRKPKRTRSHSR